MPQIQAAKKSLRSSSRRRTINDRWRKKIRASQKAIRIAITQQDKKAAQTAYIDAERILDRAAKRNIIHPNKAARKKSRLKKKINAISKVTTK